jgi:hypothetical protein
MIAAAPNECLHRAVELASRSGRCPRSSRRRTSIHRSPSRPRPFATRCRSARADTAPFSCSGYLAILALQRFGLPICASAAGAPEKLRTPADRVDVLARPAEAHRGSHRRRVDVAGYGSAIEPGVNPRLLGARRDDRMNWHRIRPAGQEVPSEAGRVVRLRRRRHRPQAGSKRERPVTVATSPWPGRASAYRPPVSTLRCVSSAGRLAVKRCAVCPAGSLR